MASLQEIKAKHFAGVKFLAYEKYIQSEVTFSQFDMAMVQAAFFASLLTFPREFGLENVPR